MRGEDIADFGCGCSCIVAMIAGGLFVCFVFLIGFVTISRWLIP